MSHCENKITVPPGSLILFQGDSITDMRRSKGVNVNYSLGNGYVYIIAGVLGMKCADKEYRVMNRGIAQDKVEDMQKRWQEDVLDIRPDVISILAGINNIGSMLNNLTQESLQGFEKIYSGLIEETRKAFPDSLIVVCEPFSLPVGTRVRNWPKRKQLLSDVHDIIFAIAQRFGTSYLKLQSTFENAALTKSYDYWMFDGVHPTPAGHGLIAKIWLDEIMGIRL